MIASLNGTIAEKWLDYARLIEQAGADALELNFYHVVTDPLEDSATAERRVLDIVAVVTELVALPVAVKLLPFYSSLPHLAVKLHALGAGGLVLFNRFWQPGIHPEQSGSSSQAQLSDSSELQLRLQWLAILFGRVRTSLAASGGVHEPLDAIRAVLAAPTSCNWSRVCCVTGPSILATSVWSSSNGVRSMSTSRSSRCAGERALPRRPIPSSSSAIASSSRCNRGGDRGVELRLRLVSICNITLLHESSSLAGTLTAQVVGDLHQPMWLPDNDTPTTGGDHSVLLPGA